MTMDHDHGQAHRLHRRPTTPDIDGRVHHVTPADAGWSYVGFDLHRLAEGQRVGFSNDGCESCAVLVEGAVDFLLGGECLGSTGIRPSPFDERPWAFYAPPGATWEVVARRPSEIAIARAPATSPRAPLFVRPEDALVELRGRPGNLRRVIDMLPQDRDVAERLLVLEAFTPAGNSSSYPPHKHDTDNLPHESRLEETYYYRIDPPSGFAFQRVYTDARDLDVAMTPGDGDLVLVPAGYHPVCAPHGYDLYYLNVMAGPRRIWKTRVDPDHAWLQRKTNDSADPNVGDSAPTGSRFDTNNRDQTEVRRVT